MGWEELSPGTAANRLLRRLVPEFLCSKSLVSVIESVALNVGNIEPLTFGSRISGFKICMMFLRMVLTCFLAVYSMSERSWVWVALWKALGSLRSGVSSQPVDVK